ncbi:MAG: DUF6045 family protein [Lacrimispora sp.]|uniref:conjugal transfer protein TrbL family protein n=1 Tax=Lacrimispora sp. TaxID=2719234 RepID=UPI0039E68081
MFIWDFVLSTFMDQMIEWFYGQLVGFLSDFFALMGNMGVELFSIKWIESIILFFSYLAWSLYVTGLVVSVFETGIEYQYGRGNVKDAAINAIKGFMAVSLFTVVPVELFKLSINLQSRLTTGITGYRSGFGELAKNIISDLGSWSELSSVISAGIFGGLSSITNPIMMLFIIVMMGYAVIKVFFANLKRGGILMIQIAVGSLYMFSIPRGYIDGFTQWCKQIIGLCLTTFLQATILAAGLMILRTQALIGLGLMLSSVEVPRVAGAFGMDTSTKANLMSAVYSAQTAVNTTRTVIQAFAPK